MPGPCWHLQMGQCWLAADHLPTAPHPARERGSACWTAGAGRSRPQEGRPCVALRDPVSPVPCVGPLAWLVLGSLSPSPWSLCPLAAPRALGLHWRLEDKGGQAALARPAPHRGSPCTRGAWSRQHRACEREPQSPRAAPLRLSSTGRASRPWTPTAVQPEKDPRRGASLLRVCTASGPLYSHCRPCAHAALPRDPVGGRREAFPHHAQAALAGAGPVNPNPPGSELSWEAGQG